MRIWIAQKWPQKHIKLVKVVHLLLKLAILEIEIWDKLKIIDIQCHRPSKLIQSYRIEEILLELPAMSFQLMRRSIVILCYRWTQVGIRASLNSHHQQEKDWELLVETKLKLQRKQIQNLLLLNIQDCHHRSKVSLNLHQIRAHPLGMHSILNFLKNNTIIFLNLKIEVPKET